jgi:hypothetical protein
MRPINRLGIATGVAFFVISTSACVSNNPSTAQSQSDTWCSNHPKQCDNQDWCAKNAGKCATSSGGN